MGTGRAGQGWRLCPGVCQAVPGWICSLGSLDLLIPAGGRLGLALGPACSLWNTAMPWELLLGWAKTSWMNVHCSLD